LPSLLAAIDACVTSPCSQSGDAPTNCTDKPTPAGADASGRECSCPSGYFYIESVGCKSECFLWQNPLLSWLTQGSKDTQLHACDTQNQCPGTSWQSEQSTGPNVCVAQLEADCCERPELHFETIVHCKTRLQGSWCCACTEQLQHSCNCGRSLTTHPAKAFIAAHM
jgi:hypothetical protein